MKNYALLDKLLNKKRDYTIEDLCKILNENKYKVREDLLYYLHDQLNKVSPNVKISSCKNMYKVFKYFENIENNKEKETFLLKFKEIEKLCKHKTKKFKKENNIYTKILSIINITFLNLNCEENINDYNLMKYIIYDLHNYNYVFEITKTFPKYLNACTKDNTIFENIVNSYIDGVMKQNYGVNTIYLEKIIKLFISNKKFNLTKENKIKILNKIKITIKEIKKNNMDISNKEKAIFFLNEVVNDINNISNKNMDDLCFKYDINQNNQESLYILEKKILDPTSLLDLRDKFIITIDGMGTSAYDDACSIEKLENGDYLLSVFVADVASYVPRNSVIDDNAYKKSETLYLPRKVITMLPLELTNKLTLKQNNDKQAIGHFFLFDKDMNCKDFNVHKCLINVNKNYSYNEITNVLTTNGDYDEQKLFNNMKDIALKLHDINTRQNYREIKSLKKTNNYNSTIGNIIIVEFMTLTNSYIASIFNEDKKLPFIYRINTGTYGNNIKREMHSLLDKSLDSEEIRNRFDKLCPPSIYSAVNFGHSGLNLQSYCHSTNPLRNYASLECQRLITEHLINNNNSIDLEKEKKYIVDLCDYMNNRINLNKVFIEECNKIKVR